MPELLERSTHQLELNGEPLTLAAKPGWNEFLVKPVKSGYYSVPSGIFSENIEVFDIPEENKPIKLAETELTEARWCSMDEALQLIRKGTTAEHFLQNAIRELKKKI